MLRAFDALRAGGATAREALLSASAAAALDANDELASLRSHFNLPLRASVAGGHGGAAAGSSAGAGAAVYLCGNSLGAQPARCGAYVAEELAKWAELGVEGHFAQPRPWVTTDEDVRASSERLVGARAGEVVCMNGLSVNLHLFLLGFYRPPPAGAAGRHKVLMEAHAFPSDAHVVKSQLALHGRAERDSLVEVAPRAGEELLRTEDVLAAIARAGDELALVLLPGVHYYTGQLLDIERITAAAHAAGAAVGWDLAHAVGNVELRLHDWGVDFAAWCSYKYLNSGPGGLAGAFLHERHAGAGLDARPHAAGWWGHRKSDRFKMSTDFAASPGAAGWMLSNPPVLAVAALRASLDVFDLALVSQPAGAGAGAIGGAAAPAVPADAPADWSRLTGKRRALTGYLEMMLRATLVADGELEVITPADEAQRGCQLSVRFCKQLSMRAVQARLQARGVVVDVREPDVMRVAPAPLYNSAEDVRCFVVELVAVVAELRKEGA